MILFAYRPDGFRELGGIYVVATEVARRLKCSTPNSPMLRTLLRDSTSRGRTPLTGVLEGTLPSARVHRGDRLLLFGCDSAWAYLLALRSRCLTPSVRVDWLPSFHDPRFVKHRWRARLAQMALKTMQRIGVHVYVQTNHERNLLEAGRCLLSSHALPLEVWHRLELEQSNAALVSQERPYDLLFLGRPTEQKGWSRFLALVNGTGLRAAAIVPTQPTSGEASAPPALDVFLAPFRDDIPGLLSKAKLVLIPSDYESFGLAQLEAVANGCVVPILGRWPLWDQFSLLHWETCTLTNIVSQCQRLCQDQSLRIRLTRLQRRYLLRHPMMHIPFLPER